MSKAGTANSNKQPSAAKPNKWKANLYAGVFNILMALVMAVGPYAGWVSADSAALVKNLYFGVMLGFVFAAVGNAVQLISWGRQLRRP